MVTVIVSTIWRSDLLWKRQHLCFLTCLLPQEKLHFWIVHDRVTMRRACLALNFKLLLLGPLGAQISQQENSQIAQEESKIPGG